MSQIPALTLTNALRAAAERCVWFEPPEEAILTPERLAAHILTYGTHADTRALTEQLREGDLALFLDAAPPGVFDPRSWAYWNLKAGRPDPPAAPTRQF